jgi:hypothetical protein
LVTVDDEWSGQCMSAGGAAWADIAGTPTLSATDARTAATDADLFMVPLEVSRTHPPGAFLARSLWRPPPRRMTNLGQLAVKSRVCPAICAELADVS